jgi:hypothetical protein
VLGCEAKTKVLKRRQTNVLPTTTVFLSPFFPCTRLPKARDLHSPCHLVTLYHSYTGTPTKAPPRREPQTHSQKHRKTKS